MKAKGSEINSFIYESWHCGDRPLDGWFLGSDKKDGLFDTYGYVVKDLDYYLDDFGTVIPQDENLYDYRFSFNDGFMMWKITGKIDPLTVKKYRLIQKIEAVKEKLRFVGMGRQSLLALQFEMRVVSEMLEKIIKELSENE